jgi:Ulp1 family protease
MVIAKGVKKDTSRILNYLIKFFVFPCNCNGYVLVFLINVFRNHWVTVVVERLIPDKKWAIYVIESLKKYKFKIRELTKWLRKFLTARWLVEKKTQKNFNVKNCPYEKLENVPKQADLYNCGIYVCLFIEMISDLRGEEIVVCFILILIIDLIGYFQ